MKLSIGNTGAALLAGLHLSFASPATAGDAEANALLVEAVQLIQLVDNHKSAEDQLAVLNEAIGKLDEIVSEHPSSGLAVSLITGQSIGNIDPAELQAKHNQLMNTVAEQQAELKEMEEEAKAHEAWVLKMMECMTSLECVDAFTTEALGERLSVPADQQAIVLEEYYEFVVKRSRASAFAISEEQFNKFEIDGFDVEADQVLGYLHRLALVGDPRFTEYFFKVFGVSSFDDWMNKVTEHRYVPLELLTSVVIHTMMSDGASAGLSRALEMRAQLSEEIAQQKALLTQSEKDTISIEERLLNLIDTRQRFAVDSLIVLVVSMLRGDVPVDDSVVRGSLQMTLDEIGLATVPPSDDYIYGVLYLASYALRLGLPSDENVAMFTSSEVSTETGSAACRETDPNALPVFSGDFELVTKDGQNVNFAEFLTGPALLFFGYSHNSDLTPMSLARNLQAVSLLEAQGHQVSPIFITVDPNRDTPQRVSEFIGTVDPKLVGLTGSSAQISKAAKMFRVFYKADSPDADGNYTVDHSIFTYALLPELGKVETLLRSKTPEEVATSVSCLIAASK